MPRGGRSRTEGRLTSAGRERGRALRLGAASLAAIAGALGCSRGEAGLPAGLAPGAAEGFHVLLVTLDTTRADRLGCYGHDGARTPVLDGLAAEGVLLADAVTVAPITLPSHASILTGLLPPEHGVRDNAEFALDPEHETLAETLAEAGYDTAAFVGAFVLDARFGLDQGFDVYDDDVGGDFAYGDFPERPAERVTDAALRWLGERTDERPFFSWVHYFDPHFPYRPPEDLARSFADAPYDGEIAHVDRQLGRLLEALEAAGLRERTLIVVVADHGESLGEHGENTHGKLIYEAVMHVPFLLVAPALGTDGQVLDDRVVSVADVTPTVLDLLGISAGRTLSGRSVLRPDEAGERAVYMEAMAPYLNNGWSPLFGLRRHRDKLIRAATRDEYFDLRADPDERTNLAGSGHEGEAALAGALETRLAGWPSPPEVAASATGLSPRDAARLEALGYAGGRQVAERTGLAHPRDMLDVEREVFRAETMLDRGQAAQALELLDEAAERSPGHRRLLLNRATALAMLGRRPEARAVLREHDAIRPSADSLLLRAQLALQDGELALTQELLERAAAIDPRHGGVWIARGDRFAALGDRARAAEAYERALEVDPHRVAEAARARLARLRGE